MKYLNKIKKYMSGGTNKLWAFGDSFTFGSELEDCPDEFVHSSRTWQALLAKEQGLEYRCIARGGVSNDWIARNVLKYANQIKTKDLVVIQWTYFSRFEFPIQGYKDVGASMKNKRHEIDTPDWIEFEDSNYFQTSPHIDIKGTEYDKNWANIKNKNLIESGAVSFNTEFYKKVYNDEYGATNLLKNLKLIQSVLGVQNYKFSFVSNEILKFHSDVGMTMDGVDSKYLIWFGEMDENLGFNEWCTKKDFPRGRYNHPLEQAHREAFKYVKEMRYV